MPTKRSVSSRKGIPRKKPSATRTPVPPPPSNPLESIAASAQGKGRGLRAADVITVVVAENPKRPGSAAFEKYALFRDGMTVGDYVALEPSHPYWPKGWATKEIQWGLKKKHLKLT